MLRKIFGNYTLLFTLIIFVGVSIGYGLYYDLKSQQVGAREREYAGDEVQALDKTWGEIQGAPVVIKGMYPNQPPVYIYKIVEKSSGKEYVVSIAKGNTPISILEAK